MIEAIFTHVLTHWGDGVAYGFLTLVAVHAVRTFPQPENKYAAWLVSNIQYAFGNYDLARRKRAPKLSVDKPAY